MPAIRTMEHAERKPKKWPDRTDIIFVFGAIGRKQLSEVDINQMRNIFKEAELIRICRNADQHASDIRYGAFDDLSTPLSFIVTGTYLPLIFNADPRENYEGRVTMAYQSTFTQEDQTCIHEVHLFNALQINKKMTVPVRYINKNKTDFIVQFTIKA